MLLPMRLKGLKAQIKLLLLGTVNFDKNGHFLDHKEKQSVYVHYSIKIPILILFNITFKIDASEVKRDAQLD